MRCRGPASLLLLSLLAGGVGCVAQAPPEPEDRQLELLQRSGRTALGSGDAAQAVMIYRQALERALLRADPPAIAVAAMDLASAQARLREYDAVLETLRAAEPLVGSLQRPQRRLLMAQVLFEQDRLDEAASALAEAEAAPELRPLVLGYRGLIAARRGDLAAAREARDRLDASASPATAARLQGLIAEREGDYPSAAAWYEREADAHRHRANFAATAEALARAGEAWAHASRPAEARHAFLLAAFSAQQQPRARLPAAQWLRRASAIQGPSTGPEAR